MKAAATMTPVFTKTPSGLTGWLDKFFNVEVYAPATPRAQTAPVARPKKSLDDLVLFASNTELEDYMKSLGG